jgi:hypothetical protein
MERFWAKPVLTGGRNGTIDSWECLGEGEMEPPGPAVTAGHAEGMISISCGSGKYSGLVKALDRE